MDFENTNFASFQEDCAVEFGQEAGAKIYSQACRLFSSMLEKADYRNSKSLKGHIEKNMFPMIAYYLTLKNNGYSKESAYGLVLKETQKLAHANKDKNSAVAKRLPFSYSIFKSLIKSVIEKRYPAEGFDYNWIRHDNEEIHVNFTKCFYLDMTTLYGCPELCTAFCKNDDVVFLGYEPMVHFERSSTLAMGAECCDFHFYSGSGLKARAGALKAGEGV